MRSRLFVLLGLTAGCGTSPDVPDLGPLMPQAISGGAPVMATPTVMPITWDVDPGRADIEAFFPQYAASTAWAAQTAEYGVGPLSVATPQHLTGGPASSDDDVRAILTANTTGAAPAWGAPSLNTVYAFFLPLGAGFDDGTGSLCCSGFDGYHDDFLVNGVDVAYSIQCMCDEAFPPPGITPLQELTTAASHEMVEAATDPRIEHGIAYADVDPAHEAWAYVTEGELADLCEFAETSYWTDAPGMTYTIQRTWSNAAAHAGTDPCVGGPTTSYYQAIPDQPDSVKVAPFGDIIASKATKIAVGATGEISVQLVGTPGSGPFTVSVNDVASLFFNASSPLLTFVQPTGMFKLNDTVAIKVTVVAKDTALNSSAGAEAFEIETKPVNGGPTTFFYGLITQ
jgi:hypothetical protein